MDKMGLVGVTDLNVI